MPKYKAVFARVYDGQIPVSIKRVPAWPCPGDNTFHTYNNPVIIVDNGLSVIFFLTGPANLLDF